MKETNKALINLLSRLGFSIMHS